MRRLSIHRAFGKVRGMGRRLRALDRWARSLGDSLPEPYEHQPFWHCKIPVLDRLVEPPTTRPAIQRQALQSLLLAAANLAEACAASDKPYCRAAVLLTLPYLFQSEVTLFYDRDYYQGFYYHKNLLPESQKPSRRYGLTLPPGFVELGNEVEWEDHTEDGELVKFSEQWWTIGQKL